MPVPPASPSARPAGANATHGAPAIVVGAGVAGLVVARELARAGVAVTLVEASDRVGGQLTRIRMAGIDLDAAAESFATRGGAVAALATELGLGDDLVRPLESPAWVIGRGGRARRLPAAGVLGIPADPRAPDVVAAIGRLGAARARLDRMLPLRHPESYRTVGDLVRRRMGRRVLRRLVAPVVRGVYSATPDALPLEVVSPGMRDALRGSRSLGAAVALLRDSSPAGSQVAGIRGGVHRLATSLERYARAAGAAVELGARVVSVDDDGVTLADGRRLDGSVVHAAAALAGPAVRTRTITVAIAVVDAPGLDAAPRGTGALVEDGVPSIGARAFTHSSAKWEWIGAQLPPHRHVVRLSYDRMPADPEKAVLDDLQAITGARIDRLIELDVRTWTRTLEAAPPVAGADAVGEAASATGLATIVAGSVATAERIIHDRDAATSGSEGSR